MSVLGRARIVRIALSATIAGLVVGVGLAVLDGDDAPQRAVVTSTATTATGVPEPGYNGRSGPMIVRAEMLRATSASGRRRGRARLTVTVRMRNGTDRPRAAPSRPTLLVGDRAVRADRVAAGFAGGLLEPLAPHSTATGMLRFETAGATTRRLLQRRRALLRIAGRTLPVGFRRPAP